MTARLADRKWGDEGPASGTHSEPKQGPAATGHPAAGAQRLLLAAGDQAGEQTSTRPRKLLEKRDGRPAAASTLLRATRLAHALRDTP